MLFHKTALTHSQAKRKTKKQTKQQEQQTTTATMGSTNSTANADDGFDETDTNLRSILLHPIGLSLTAFLYDQPSSTLPDDYWSILPNGSKSVYESCIDQYHRFLSKQTSKTDSSLDLNFSDQSERIWAKKLLQDANEYCASETDNRLVVEQENDAHDSASVDAIIYDKCRYKNKSMVSIIGFGLNNEDWWKTKHRVLQNLKKLLKDRRSMFTDEKAFLLVIITVDPIDKTHVKGAKRLKIQVGDPASRFGVFLCTKKDDKTIRTGMLWRKQLSNQAETTSEFIKLFAALQFAAIADCRRNTSYQKNFFYLGGNCSKFGNRVSVSVLVSSLIQQSMKEQPTNRTLYFWCFYYANNSCIDRSIQDSVLQTGVRTFI